MKRGWKHPMHVDAFLTLEAARAVYPHVERFKRCFVDETMTAFPDPRSIRAGGQPFARRAVAYWCKAGLVLGEPGSTGELLFTKARITEALHA